MPSRKIIQKTVDSLWVDLGEGLDAVECVIRRYRRARNMRLRVDFRGRALVSVPFFCGNAEALRFLRGNRDWLASQLVKLERRPTLTKWLRTEGRLSGGGRWFQADLTSTACDSYLLLDRGQRLVVLALERGGDREAAAAKLCRDFAREVIPGRVRALAEAVGVAQPKRVSIRNQGGRWGSLSSSGTLSLNWRLVLLEPALHDHIIYHELAHTRHMNHSTRFWNLLRSWDSRTDAFNVLLNERASELMPLGR